MSQSNIGARPAYPHLEVTSKGEPYHDHLGMTIRQAYKMAALSRISAEEMQSLKEVAGKFGKDTATATAGMCAEIADAMLDEDAAHEKEGQQAHEKGDGA